MDIELDVERKATPLSAFPKNEPGKPGIFVKKTKDKKAEYSCFCIKDIYSDLFAGTKKRAGDNADGSALIYFPKSPHTIKQNKELLRFLLPQDLFEQIEKNTQDGKQYVKDYDYKEFFLVSTNNNKITKLPGGERNTIKMSDVNGNNRYEINGYTSSIYGTDNVITAVGYALGSFYGWQTNGVFADEAAASQATSTVVTWQDAAGNSYSNDGHLLYPTGKANGEDKYRNFQSGDICFVDQNGDGVIDDADKVVIGNPNPDIYGNIFTSLTWKDLRLDVNFKYSLGNDVYNYQRSIVEGLNTSYNQTKAVLRRWTYEGQKTDMPKACYTNSDDWRNNERMSDRWIEDGSFLKLKNIRLTYTVPYSNSWLLGLKVWAEGNNLFTISKYLGTDPEMSSSNNVLYQGIDTGLVPCGRGFNVGVSINL